MHLEESAVYDAVRRRLGDQRYNLLYDVIEMNLPMAVKMIQKAGIEHFHGAYFRTVDQQIGAMQSGHSHVREQAKAFCVVFHALFCAIEELAGFSAMDIPYTMKYRRWS
ncbi:hypothetical protein FJZ28_01060 [Candidatus Peregrinibacteria bacterium]|nr:hypothetical protein [Candidatus Peregrinibacteria bacterium]